MKNELHATLKLEIERQAKILGPYHGPRFAQQAPSWVASFIADAVGNDIAATLDEEGLIDLLCNSNVGTEGISHLIDVFATGYASGVSKEQKRIAAIDEIAQSLPPGHKAAIHEAKFVTCIEAEQLAQQVLAWHQKLFVNASGKVQ